MSKFRMSFLPLLNRKLYTKTTFLFPNIHKLSKASFSIQNHSVQSNDPRTAKDVFSELYPWVTVTDLAEHLLESKVYHQDNLLVVNKPYGIPKEAVKDSIHTSSYGASPQHRLSLNDCVNKLKELLSVDYLEIVLCPERWCSGFTAISLSPKVTDRLNHSHSVACHSREIPNRHHLLLCYGAPLPLSTELSRTGTQMVSVPGTSYKLPIIAEKISRKNLDRRIVKSVMVEHNTLATNEEKSASLVRIISSSNKNHFQRVWMAQKLAPVLGDKMFSSRVTTFMGNKVPVPHNRARVGTPVYSMEFLDKLSLSPKDQTLLPLFCHSETLRLPHFLDKRNYSKTVGYALQTTDDFNYRELKVKVPMPDHFKWIMEKLQLSDVMF